MGIFTGLINLVCFLMLVAKAITHRCNWKKMDRFLMKCHKPICVLLIVSCFMHMIFILPVLKNRSVFVIITGIVSFFVMVSLICLCHIIKEKKKKMWWHKFLAIIMAICIEWGELKFEYFKNVTATFSSFTHEPEVVKF